MTEKDRDEPNFSQLLEQFTLSDNPVDFLETPVRENAPSLEFTASQGPASSSNTADVSAGSALSDSNVFVQQPFSISNSNMDFMVSMTNDNMATLPSPPSSIPSVSIGQFYLESSPLPPSYSPNYPHSEGSNDVLAQELSLLDHLGTPAHPLLNSSTSASHNGVGIHRVDMKNAQSPQVHTYKEYSPDIRHQQLIQSQQQDRHPQQHPEPQHQPALSQQPLQNQQYNQMHSDAHSHSHTQSQNITISSGLGIPETPNDLAVSWNDATPAANYLSVSHQRPRSISESNVHDRYPSLSYVESGFSIQTDDFRFPLPMDRYAYDSFTDNSILNRSASPALSDSSAMSLNAAPPAHDESTGFGSLMTKDNSQYLDIPNVRKSRRRSNSASSTRSDVSASGRSKGISKAGSSVKSGGSSKAGSRSPSPRRIDQSRDYVLHLASHEASKSPQRTSEGHFKCPNCEASFTRKYNLNSHMLTHTKDRPFKCKYCTKEFTRAHDRRRHELLHEGVKRFHCGGELSDGGKWGCGATFARSDALARHLKSEKGRQCIRPLQEDEERLRAIEFTKLHNERAHSKSNQDQTFEVPEIQIQIADV
ncbi:hypothetical protein CANCADRAFT_43665 [Tortispora caseinolytica NRRL Y-17796]|uniref:C2H2-type domain-containing protein n=1 Tax=Tortispora caseinolytica NRRL Y-17796 TaxID=767744 RepID=A0A1E4TDY1_9ASCO|nr:hypothetical protein CANCADRAFT_43665 [Tortispora caseinolytica NRRL Y-17796]